MGKSLLVVRSQIEFATALARYRPRFILVDLGARGIDVESAIRSGKQVRSARLVAFGPHKDVHSRATALSAGADRWVTNQRLVETLGAELRGEGTNVDVGE